MCVCVYVAVGWWRCWKTLVALTGSWRPLSARLSGTTGLLSSPLLSVHYHTRCITLYSENLTSFDSLFGEDEARLLVHLLKLYSGECVCV